MRGREGRGILVKGTGEGIWVKVGEIRMGESAKQFCSGIVCLQKYEEEKKGEKPVGDTCPILQEF